MSAPRRPGHARVNEAPELSAARLPRWPADAFAEAPARPYDFAPAETGEEGDLPDAARPLGDWLFRTLIACLLAAAALGIWMGTR